MVLENCRDFKECTFSCLPPGCANASSNSNACCPNFDAFESVLHLEEARKWLPNQHNAVILQCCMSCLLLAFLPLCCDVMALCCHGASAVLLFRILLFLFTLSLHVALGFLKLLLVLLVLRLLLESLLKSSIVDCCVLSFCLASS